MNAGYDIAIVGGGILGLAQAWMASRFHRRVLLVERSPRARGASVRNFGIVWPIGQPAGEMYDVALRSRELWLELAARGVIEATACGSIHLAHRGDELAVLDEFCKAGTHDAAMMTPGEVLQRTPLANPEGLLGGMFSSTELRVDPRTACQRIAGWLADSESVECHFNTSIVRLEDNLLQASDGRTWWADRVVVCSGSDLQTLYPDLLAASGLRLCKLQMLKTVPQPAGYRDSLHLASGLTLRHYPSFAGCPSLESLATRVATETPELDRYGIHVMASQNGRGEVILGDSHEYDAAIEPFDKTEIDDLILRELRRVIRLGDWTIGQRWSGIYAKHPQRPVLEADTPDGHSVFIGAGGAGMTLGFGLADRFWNQRRGAVA